MKKRKQPRSYFISTSKIMMSSTKISINSTHKVGMYLLNYLLNKKERTYEDPKEKKNESDEKGGRELIGKKERRRQKKKEDEKSGGERVLRYVPRGMLRLRRSASLRSRKDSRSISSCTNRSTYFSSPPALSAL